MDTSNSSGPKQFKGGSAGKILSTGGLLMAVLLSLLVGLALVIRSLRKLKLSLHLKINGKGHAEKKH